MVTIGEKFLIVTKDGFVAKIKLGGNKAAVLSSISFTLTLKVQLAGENEIRTASDERSKYFPYACKRNIKKNM